MTTLSFDIAFLELFLPLVVGARTVLAPRETAMDGTALVALVRSQRATIMQATPAMWRAMVDAGWSAEDRLRVLSGGEALSLDLARALVTRSNEVWNLYGPTETTVWSTCWRVPSTVSRVLVGRPIGNTQCHVLDAYGQQVPVGVAGELSIGGAGVALGYLGQEELTSRRFVPDASAPAARQARRPLLYRTGDMVRWVDGGAIEHLGRNDDQIKLRGYRIEPAEVEARLEQHPSVREACVVVRHLSSEDARLIAYYAPVTGRTVTATDLRASLREKLPDYMVPSTLVELSALPRTPNGKLDKKALPAPFQEAQAADVFAPPRTDNELLVAEIWREVVGVPEIGLHDNFFNLGGHSLLALRAMALIAQRTGTRPNPRSFVLDTLEQFAAQLPPPCVRAAAPPPTVPASSPKLGARLYEKFKQHLFG